MANNAGSNNGPNMLATLEGSRRALEDELQRAEFISDKVQAEIAELNKFILAWTRAKAEAQVKMEKKLSAASLSKDSLSAMDDLFKIADSRLEAYQAALAQRGEQRDSLMQNKDVMVALQSRMKHLEFRDSMRISMPEQTTNGESTIPGSELNFRAIGREIKKVGHALDALQELQSGELTSGARKGHNPITD